MPRPATTGGEAAGFTFLELIVVVGLIALLSSLLLPQVPQTLPFEVRGAARIVAADLRYAGQRAIATGRPHYWVVDLEAQEFRIEVEHDLEDPEPRALVSHAGLLDLSPPGPEREVVPVSDASGNWRTVESPDIEIQRVVLGPDEFDDNDTARIAFAPDGAADSAEVWLVDPDGRELLLAVFPFTGEVRVVEEPDVS